MDPFVRSVFLEEAIVQCDYALNAAQNLNFALGQIAAASEVLMSGKVAEGEAAEEIGRQMHKEVFRSVHSLLTHASNVSRIFWPPPSRRKRGESDADFQRRNPQVRGDSLRAYMELTDDNVLKSRTIRDHLEHFDERLDHWAATSVGQNYIQGIVGPSNSFSGPFPAGDMMRWYDTTINAMRFRGDVFELQPIANALQALMPLCVAARDKSRNETLNARRGRRDGEVSESREDL